MKEVLRAADAKNAENGDVLELERIGKTLVIRFIRPQIRNPLSVVVLEQLDEIIDSPLNDEIDDVIFTGTDDIFASGADLREIAKVTAETAREFAMRGQDLMTKIASLSQTTIAAINGYCFGGALDLALACDKRIASPNAKFAHPGTGLGIITGWGGTQRLPRLIGQTAALEMFFTAEAIDSQRALEIGLIDMLADDALAESFAWTVGVVSS
ncbi:MAG: enoyl-CoA hydratase/isomerase family protein [Pyrinomonadaceae bacterium]